MLYEVTLYTGADAGAAPGLTELPPELLQGLADWLPTFGARARLRALWRGAGGLEWRAAPPRHVEEELSGLALGDLGAKAVCGALTAVQNAALRELCLGANGIGDEGAQAVAAALLSPSVALRRLSLRDNCITDKGALALAAALARNSTLEELDLWGNHLSEQGKKLILSAARCEAFVEGGPPEWPCGRPVGSTIKPKVRKILFDWLVQVQTGMPLPSSVETAPDPQDMLFRTFSHIDTYLVRRVVHRSDLQLIGVAATWIAAGIAEEDDPEAAEMMDWLSFVTDGACTAEELRDFSRELRELLGTQRHKPTPYTFLRRYLRRTGWTQESFSLANYCIELAALDASFLAFRPQVVAAAAAVVSRQYGAQGVSVRQTPRWKTKLLQGADIDLELELAPCAAAMTRLHAAQAAQAELFVNKKYQSARLHGVARLRPHPPSDAAYFAQYLAADAFL